MEENKQIFTSKDRRTFKRKLTIFEWFLQVGWVILTMAGIWWASVIFNKVDNIVLTQELVIKGIRESVASQRMITKRIDAVVSVAERAHGRIDVLEKWVVKHDISYPNVKMFDVEEHKSRY